MDMGILKYFISHSEVCYIYFHVILPNFCENINSPFSFLGCPTNINDLMRKGKMEK